MSPAAGFRRGLASPFAATNLLSILLLAGVALALVTPVIVLATSSLQIEGASRFGLENWQRIVREPALLIALLNTVSLAIARQAIALVLGVGLAWLIACSDLPGRRWFEVGFWIALFMPPLPAILSWILLLGGNNSVINQALAILPFANPPTFHIFSWWGIVLVHMLGATLAVKVFLLVPALRAIDSSYEEAARASGASLPRTLVSIVVPLLAPAIIVTSLIGIVRSMQSFEIELILGAPAGIDVYSTLVYKAMAHEPPDQGLASALSIAFLLALVPFVVLQQGYVRTAAHGVTSGRMRSVRQPLGGFKWPAFSLVAILVSLMTIVPVVCLVTSTFMPLFGIFDLPDPWTLDNWRAVWTRGDVISSLWNSLKLGFTSALVAMILFAALAYHIVRSRRTLASLLDFCTWLPTLLPGVVLSLGLLEVFSGVPILRNLYGTMGTLVIAILLGTVTVGVQFLKTSLRQLGRDLEEAGWASGGGRFYVVRRIVIPLIAPSVAVVGLETFAAANAAVGVISLLGVGPIQPLSILQLNLMTSGQFEAASVVGVTILALTVGSAICARGLADRFSVGPRA